MDTLGLNSYISRSNMDISCRGPGDNVILSRQEQQGKSVKHDVRRPRNPYWNLWDVFTFHWIHKTGSTCVYLVKYSRNDTLDKSEMPFHLKMLNSGSESRLDLIFQNYSGVSILLLLYFQLCLYKVGAVYDVI